MAQSDPDIQRGLEILKLIRPDAQPTSQSSPEDPDIQRGLEILKLIQPQQQQPASQEESFGELAQLVGRGILASGPGGTIDLLEGKNLPLPNNFGGIDPAKFRPDVPLASKMSGKSPEEISRIYAEQDERNKPINAGEKLTKAYNNIIGNEDLKPKTWKGHLAETAGQFISPDIASKGKMLIKGGFKLTNPAKIKSLAKSLTKDVGKAVGGASAIHAPIHMTEEGTPARLGEDIGKAIIGSKLGGAAITPIQSTKNAALKGTAKLMSLGAKPDKEVLDLAQKHGIDLPHHIGMNSKVLSGVENNYLNKSMFTSQKHKDVYKNAAEKMLDEVNESVDKVSKNSVKPSDASSKYRSVLQNEEKVERATASNMYKDAEELLNKKDKVAPSNTATAILSIQKILSNDLRSPDNLSVSKHLGKLKKKWGIVKPTKKNDNKNYTKDISLDKLVGVDKEINAILGSNETPGVKKLLRGLQSAVVEDISSSTNQAFVDAYMQAKDYFKENVGKRFNTKTPRSILKSHMPTEAFSKMNTVQGIKTLEKSLGTSPEAIKTFGELKRAKLEEMLEKATVGGLETGDLSNANFTNLFAKNRKRQEILEYLLGGREQYKKLEEISKITNAFSKAGKDIINTSGTAPVAAEWSKLDRAAQAAFLVLMGTEPVSGLIMAGSAVAAPNVLSRIVSNKNIVSQARAYALARQKGNDKYAQSILNNLIKMVGKEANTIRTVGVNSATKSKEGDKDNEH